jgi:hypothetical protein
MGRHAAAHTAARTHAAGAAHVVRGRRSGTIGCTNTGVVLRATPRQTNARVTNGISLHLIDGHLSSMTVNKLNESAALAGGNLHVGDLSKALEERTELILGHIARQASDEHSGVVWIGELVHRRHGVELLLGIVSSRGGSAPAHGTASHVTATGNGSNHLLVAAMPMAAILVRTNDGQHFCGSGMGKKVR